MKTYTERTYTSKDGLSLYYRDYAGPADSPFTLLCLPGLTRNCRDFEDFAAFYSTQFRVLCADFRGRGKSEYAKDPLTYQPPFYVQDVARLLEAAQVSEAVFVGTSLGGLVSMMSANLIRHRVKALVINDVGPEIDAAGLARIRGYLGKMPSFASWEGAAEAIRELNAQVYPHWLVSDWMTMARRLCAEVSPGDIRPDYDSNIAVPFNSAGPVAQVDLWPVFTGLNGLPVLAIRGALSDILSDNTLQKMKTAVPALHMAVVPDVGHAPYLMEPTARDSITAFLASIAASPRSLWKSLPYRISKRLSSIYYAVRLLKQYQRK